MKLTFILGFIFAAQINAQTLVSAEPKTPFIVASCQTIGVDAMGTLGLTIDQFSFQESDKQITFSVMSSLATCVMTVDSNQNKSLGWQQVNPFKGFNVQYYEDATRSIQTRPVYIDSKKSYNRIELVAVSTDTDTPARISNSKMTESIENTFSGSFTINKSDVLSKKEIQLIKSGKVVKKMIELYHVGNFTTLFNGEDLQLGDNGLAAQNIVLTFKK